MANFHALLKGSTFQLVSLLAGCLDSIYDHIGRKKWPLLCSISQALSCLITPMDVVCICSDSITCAYLNNVFVLFFSINLHLCLCMLACDMAQNK